VSRWVASSHVLLATVLTGAVLLAACGDDEPVNLPPSIVITVPPEPISTLLPGCEADALESWYEVAGWLLGTFKDESEAALNKEPGAMGPVIARLTDLRDTIATQAVPECARQAHTTILAHLRQMLFAFEQYATGNLDQQTLREQIKALAAKIDADVLALLEETRAELELQLRIERATEKAIPSP